jgi:response regulator RpfG family c-di-GMP phosphodiesterase
VNVLLLEDDRNLQRATARLIRYTYPDAAISVTNTCAKTIALLQHERFDLVVSDFEVLDGTGDAVLYWVREMQPHLVARFVFFSGSSGLEKLHDKVIEKGCTVEEFVDQLRGFIGGVQ